VNLKCDTLKISSDLVYLRDNSIDSIMKIKSFKFDDHKENWHLKETFFDDFNLLVGVSGVGKTKILQALDLVRDVARDNDYRLDGIEWTIRFTHFKQEYEWTLKSALTDDEKSIFLSKTSAEITYEKITLIENNNATELLIRSENGSHLRGEKLHKLKKTESALASLSEEEDIAPIYQAFERVFNETPQYNKVPFLYPIDVTKVLIKRNINLHTFFENIPVDMPRVFKGYYLQKFFPESFDEIKASYLEIFPKVDDIKIDMAEKSGGYIFSYAIKESTNNWILQPKISSGMLRTLAHLIEISTAPTGSVIVIDEFENSLGINCMPELTDFILDKSNELQFILTSHHPYIIHNIPWENWQIVSRNGSDVKVTNATYIPELDTASSLDKFTQLVNLPEYEGGIS